MFGAPGTSALVLQCAKRLAPGVGVLRRFAVQVLDVVAQAFLGQQPGDEGEVALAAEHSRSECARHDGCLCSFMNRPGTGAGRYTAAQRCC